MNIQSKQFFVAISIAIALMAPFVCISHAEEISIPMPAFEGDYEYLGSRGPYLFDLGTSLKTVSVMRVNVVGYHTMGWWDGHDHVDFYHGPRGGKIYFAVNYPNSPLWRGGQTFVSDGFFSLTNTLHTLQSANGDWSFLSDGISDFYVENQEIPAMGADGGFTIPPQISVFYISLQIEAERNLSITQLSTNGNVSWLPAYTQGVINIEVAASPTGHWERISSTTASNTTLDLELPPDNTQFIRAVLENN